MLSVSVAALSLPEQIDVYRPLVQKHTTVALSYVITTIFITALSIFFLFQYKEEAKKDCILILLCSLIGAIAFHYVIQESNILTAAALGVFTGESIGLLWFKCRNHVH